MIFEIPLDHFPQPFTSKSTIHKDNDFNNGKNASRSTNTNILTKLKETLTLQPTKSIDVPLIENDSSNKKSKTLIERRKLFCQKDNKSFSISIDSNISLNSITSNLCQSITNLKCPLLMNNQSF